jgi:hypothetical protein
MTEQTSPKEKIEEHIPQDVRDHVRAAREEVRKSIAGIFPPEFREHRQKARKEILLAFRGLVDYALQRIDEAAATK